MMPAWCPHDVCMICAWCLHDVHMMSVWCIHDVCMIILHNEDLNFYKARKLSNLFIKNNPHRNPSPSKVVYEYTCEQEMCQPAQPVYIKGRVWVHLRTREVSTCSTRLHQRSCMSTPANKRCVNLLNPSPSKEVHEYTCEQERCQPVQPVSIKGCVWVHLWTREASTCSKLTKMKKMKTLHWMLNVWRRNTSFAISNEAMLHFFILMATLFVAVQRNRSKFYYFTHTFRLYVLHRFYRERNLKNFFFQNFVFENIDSMPELRGFLTFWLSKFVLKIRSWRFEII